MRVFVFIVSALFGLVASQAPDVIEDGLASSSSDEEILVADVQTSGAGCPKGSVEIYGSVQTQQIVYGPLPAFKAAIGPNVPQSEASKDCVVKATLTYPKNTKFTVKHSLIDGHARLDQGVTGAVDSYYSFASNKSKAVRSSILTLRKDH